MPQQHENEIKITKKKNNKIAAEVEDDSYLLYLYRVFSSMKKLWLRE
jgi:hypothetical protein